MKLEHVAFQVQDPVALSQWYVAHLGLRVKRAQTASPFGHFLADDGDAVMLEFYNNPALAVPAYRDIPALALHLAFDAPEMQATIDRLIAAGATLETALVQNESGDAIAMLRDPWGLPLQLVSRVTPMLR
jgi:catechol 2,3-dioxygenase-like lactoylglutathione lyase family enzyme